MTKQYGVDYLQEMKAGNSQNQMVTIASQLAGSLSGLAFSLTDETEADETAVMFLSNTDYNPLGVAGFFHKLSADGQSGGTPTFLSTHPSPSDRISKIQAAWAAHGSKKGNDFTDRYREVKKCAQIIAK